MQVYTQEKIRNIAIIAHVDHGKTTLVDAFLKQTHTFRDNQDEINQEAIMDTGELEREKGITITAKVASVYYEGYKINIIDTPGHADFGGEVERTLNMADGCLLIVDAQEGPMPQTQFVLRKALESGLKPIVVINKIDKQYADPKKALDKVNDLFLSMVTDMDQLDFPVFYAIGRDGKVFKENPTAEELEQPATIAPLMEAIIEQVPAPTGDKDGSFQMLITSVDYDSHLGKLLIGRISRGNIKTGQKLTAVNGLNNENPNRGEVRQLFIKDGLKYVPVDSASTGEIVAIAGIESNYIGGTLCAADNIDPLPTIKLSPPSVQAKFEANSSPFVGQDGEFVTAKQIQQRLEKEKESNISLQITKTAGGGAIVAGRGELQLAILIEELRREGYELQVRRPEVILKEIDGKMHEPMEMLIIDSPSEYQGDLMNSISRRHGDLQNMETENNNSRFTYKILTRNLLGLHNELNKITKGQLEMSHYVDEYVPCDNATPELYRKGVLIASETGTAAAYALNSTQERGDLIITPSTEVYEGMIVGLNKYDQDMEVNVCKAREQTAVRRNLSEITRIALKAPIQITLEYALVFLAKDEVLEVTPKHLRLRKLMLKKHERVKAKRSGTQT